MSYVKKLVIGTANMGQEYNGNRIPQDVIEKIWEYCTDKGIDYADCATAYEYIPPEWTKSISKITKPTDEMSRYATLIHHTEDVPKLWPALWQFKLMSAARGYPFKLGVSIYSVDELTCLPYDIIQLPYKPCKKDLAKLKKRGIEIHVRKVFADNCFEEAVKDPLVDFVVIGVDNLEQLKENVELCLKWDEEEKDD